MILKKNYNRWFPRRDPSFVKKFFFQKDLSISTLWNNPTFPISLSKSRNSLEGVSFFLSFSCGPRYKSKFVPDVENAYHDKIKKLQKQSGTTENPNMETTMVEPSSLKVNNFWYFELRTLDSRATVLE